MGFNIDVNFDRFSLSLILYISSSSFLRSLGKLCFFRVLFTFLIQDLLVKKSLILILRVKNVRDRGILKANIKADRITLIAKDL